MAGDVDNVAVWAEADVLIGPLTAANPTGGEDFALTGTDPWSFVGILDGSAGFTESQASASTDHTGWGVGVVATTRKDQTITVAFTALEDNEETLSLRYDTTGVTFASGGYSGDLAGRDLQDKFKLAREVRTGGVIKRQITKNYAQVESLGDVTEGEDNLAKLPVVVKIYPEIVDGKSVYWETYKGPAS